MTTSYRFGGTKAALERAARATHDAETPPPAAPVRQTPADPEEQLVADAEHQAAEAARAVVELEEKVRDGDTTVTHEQIREARGIRDVANMAIDGARRAAQRRRDQKAAEHRARLVAAAEAELAAVDDAVIAAKYAEVFPALLELWDLAVERRRVISKHLAILSPRDVEQAAGRGDVVITRDFMTNAPAEIQISGRKYHPRAYDPKTLLEQMVKRVNQVRFHEERFPGRPIDPEPAHDQLMTLAAETAQGEQA